MKIGHGSKFVEFEITEVGDPLATCHSVHIQNGGFAGSVDDVWIGYEQSMNFLEQLDLLERNSVEAVELRNFSYGTDVDPLIFAIRQVNPLGHIGIFATVTKVEIVRGELELLRTSICFELDREFLTMLTRGFKKLFSR